MTIGFVETPAERCIRYVDLAAKAVAAAATASTPQARTAYLLLAEAWNTLAEAKDTQPPSVFQKIIKERSGE